MYVASVTASNRVELPASYPAGAVDVDELVPWTVLYLDLIFY